MLNFDFGLHLCICYFQECASGYYRSHTTPYLGICVPCECNGHADSCDPLNGECLVSVGMDRTYPGILHLNSVMSHFSDITQALVDLQASVVRDKSVDF